MGKLFEKIIKFRLEKYLEINNVLPKSQSGFRDSRSTTDNLVYVTEKMKEALRYRTKGRYITYFDVQKAFDRAWHAKLLSKLSNIGISGHVYNVIKNFLSILFLIAKKVIVENVKPDNKQTGANIVVTD